MKVWKRIISATMAAVMVLCLPGPAWAAEKSAAGKESPWKQSWQAGDPTSSQAGTYQIYPVPQELTMTEGKALVLPKEIKVAVGNEITQPTRDYLTEVLEQIGSTVQFVDANDASAQIRLGVKGTPSEAVKVFESANLEKAFAKPDAYAIRVDDKAVTILGAQPSGAFYGVATLKMMLSSLENHQLPQVEIHDWASIPLRGFVEGFYGGFNHQQRVSLMNFARDVKMNLYVYAAKSDRYHTDWWDKLYPEQQMKEFRELVALENKTGCEFAWSVHLGSFFRGLNDQNYAERKDKLIAKFDQLRTIGVNRFCILNDDFGSGSTDMVVRLLNDLNQNYVKKNNCKPMIYCPQQYNNAWSDSNGKREIKGLTGLDDDIMIFWTGRDVNSPFWQDAIDYVIQNTKDHKNPNSFQKPVFWVNYPCSEHAKSGVFLGSSKYYLRDNIHDLGGAVSNPIFFAETDKVALFQLANYFWNVHGAEARADQVWEQCFKYLQPEVYDAYLTIARNVSNAPGSSRVPGFEESLYMAKELDTVQNAVKAGTLKQNDANAEKLLAEFAHIRSAITDFKTNCKNDILVKELSNPGFLAGINDGEGWLHALDDVAAAAGALLEAQLELAGEKPDMNMVWDNFAKASAAMSRYNSRTYTFPDRNTTPNPKAGTKRLVPFVEEVTKTVKAAVDREIGIAAPVPAVNRVYTNVENYARTPLTIQDAHFALCKLDVSLQPNQYLGIKKDGIAEITEIDLTATGLEKLTLEWSLNGDQWTVVQPGKQEKPILARYLRLINRTKEAVAGRLESLGMQVANETPIMRFADTNIAHLKENSWEQMIDGNLSTYVWTQKDQATGDYVTFDTGALQEMHDITIYSTDGKDHIYQAEVLVSADNQTFEQVGVINDESNANNIRPPHRVYEFDAKGKKARYIRLRNTQNSNPPAWMHLYELEVNKKTPPADRTPSAAVIGSQPNHLELLTDGNLSTMYQLKQAGQNDYLEYRITDNTNVNKISILQNQPCNADVIVTMADGTTKNLGKADQPMTQFTLPEGGIHSIRLNFVAGKPVEINEIVLKCGADASGDVGQAVENIYPSQRPEDSTESVNLALKRPVKVSGTETSSVKPESAVDGNDGTKWDSGAMKGAGAKTPQWIEVDLGEYTNLISSFSMSYFNKVYPTDYDVQVSNDGKTWTTVKTLTRPNDDKPNPVDTFTLDVPVQARHVRLLLRSINTAAAGNCVGLKELVVNGQRRTADMAYTAVTNPENQQLEVGASWTAPTMADAQIKAENDSAATAVRVLADWNPTSIDTSVSGSTVMTGTLPQTVNLSNPKNLQVEFTVKVGEEPQPEAPSNLALNAKVEVSAVEMSGGSETAFKGPAAVDGNADTRWSSGPLNHKMDQGIEPADQWIIVDLGEQALEINQIQATFFRKVWPMQYRMELSMDKENWVTVEQYDRPASDNTQVVDTKDFETPVYARYLRLYFPVNQLNTNAAGSGVSITELTVNGMRLNGAVDYCTLTDTFTEKTFPNEATTADLQLPAWLTMTWKAQNGAERPVQVLAQWNTEGFDALKDGKMDLLGAPATTEAVTNSQKLVAVQPILKGVIPTATPEPTAEPTAAPTATPEPTAEPTAAPTATPEPTAEPTAAPTATPEPSAEPTAAPTATPEPSAEPTAAPTATPEPTAEPTAAPTATPEPTAEPTAAPTATPEPTAEPAANPTATPAPAVENTPRTGDSTWITVQTMLLLAAASGAAILLILRKQRGEKNHNA